MNSLRNQILTHTLPTRRHLTPELVLRLITPRCPLWTAPAECVPFPDPFWGFYWPGGQAAARYILDNGQLMRNRRILDVGCGCGAAAIAASKMSANFVVANDIDLYATEITQINSELNETTLETNNKNFIGTKCEDFDTILIGDMFYDEQFAEMLFTWLKTLAAQGKMVLIGDPGRHGLTEKRRHQMTLLATYQLPKESQEENHGYTHTTLWRLNK